MKIRKKKNGQTNRYEVKPCVTLEVNAFKIKIIHFIAQFFSFLFFVIFVLIVRRDDNEEKRSSSLWHI